MDRHIVKLAFLLISLTGSGYCRQEVFEIDESLLSSESFVRRFIERSPMFLKHLEERQRQEDFPEKRNRRKRSVESVNSLLSGSPTHEQSDREFSNFSVAYSHPNCTDPIHDKFIFNGEYYFLGNVTPITMFFAGSCLNLIEIKTDTIYESIFHALSDFFQVPKCNLAIEKVSCRNVLIIKLLVSRQYLTLDDVDIVLNKGALTINVGGHVYQLDGYSTPKHRIFAMKSIESIDHSFLLLIFLIGVCCAGAIIFICGWMYSCIEHVDKRKEKKQSYGQVLQAYAEAPLVTDNLEKQAIGQKELSSFHSLPNLVESEDSFNDFTSESESELNNYNMLLGVVSCPTPSHDSNAAQLQAREEENDSCTTRNKEEFEGKPTNQLSSTTRINFEDDKSPFFRIETDL